MDSKYYSFHWTHVVGKEIVNENDLYYHTTIDFYNIEDMKAAVRISYSLNPDSVILLHNIQEITKEIFDLKTGNRSQFLP